jgi:cytochrome P450
MVCCSGMGVSRRVQPEREAPTAPPEWMGVLQDDAALFLYHPLAIQHVLHDNHANYIKGAFYDRLRMLLGEGLLTSEGPTWLSERRLAQPAFQAGALDAYHPVMVETIAAFLQGWRARAWRGRAVEISREMARLTLQVVTKSLFAIDLGKREDRILDAITELFPFDPMSRGPLLGRAYRYLPFFARIRAHRARLNFERGISWILANCSGSDVISRLTGASIETGASADRRIRDEAATFLIAGYETTAVCLTWALYLLCRHPEIEQKVRAEIAEVLEHRPPALSDLPRLAYTGMVIQETLRLYPPIPSFGRQAIRDDEIAGYTIRSNTKMRIKPIQTHRHPDFWPDPERFSPERFSAEQSAARPRCAYIPFGAGPRACIGAQFAMMEMKLALAMMLRAIRFSPAPGRPVAVMGNLTLRPRYGMWMIPEFSSGPE